MFSTFLQQVGGYFDRRWLLSAFFPSLVFWSSVLLVYSFARGIKLVTEEWRGAPPELQLLLPVGGLIALSFFAFFVSAVQMKILRLFEGYWDGMPLLARIGVGRRAYYQARVQYLEERSLQLLAALDRETQREEAMLSGAPTQTEPQSKLARLERDQQRLERERFTTLPTDINRVLPTALGNALRAAEEYSGLRYGPDGVLLWPRLQPFLPEALLSALGSSRTTLEASVNVAFLAGIFAFGAGTLVALFSSQRLLFAACLLGLPVAWAGYFAGVASALAYGDLVRSSFDLYRGKLLEGLGFKAATDYGDERRIWADVNFLIYRGYPPVSARYLNASEPVPETPARLDWKTNLWNWIARTWTWIAAKRVDAHTDSTDSHEAAAADPAPAAATPTAVPIPQAAHALEPEPPRDRRTTAIVAFVIVAFGVGGTLLAGQAAWTKEAVRVPTRDLAAYHIIRAEDLVDQRVDRVVIPAGALTADSELVGQLTLAPVGPHAILLRQQVRALPAGVTTEGAVAVALTVSASSLAGGGLRAGDVVDVIARTDAAADQPTPGVIRLERVVVLNVPSVATPTTERGQAAEQTASLLVAVPQQAVDQLAHRDPAAPVLIVRAL